LSSLLIDVNLARNKKEIVADAVEKNSEIKHPDERAGVAEREHQVAQ
jgi:hypothetical protein